MYVGSTLRAEMRLGIIISFRNWRSAELPGFQEADFGPLPDGLIQFPSRPGKQHRRPVAILGHAGEVLVRERFQLGRIGSVQPARGLLRRDFEPGLDLVFRCQARGEDVQLQMADDTHDPLRADQRPEHLRHAFLGQVL
jgi:hypothetical protein